MHPDWALLRMDVDAIWERLNRLERELRIADEDFAEEEEVWCNCQRPCTCGDWDGWEWEWVEG